MRILFTLSFWLLLQTINAQSNLILDSVVKPAKVLVKDNHAILGNKKIFGKIDASISVYYNKKASFYFSLLNAEKVIQPTSFLQLYRKVDKKVWDTYLHHTADLLPPLSGKVKQYIEAINNLYCKEAIQGKLFFFDTNYDNQKNTINKKLSTDTAIKKLEKAAQAILTNADLKNMSSYADLYLLSNCSYYSDQVFQIAEFSDRFWEGEYLTSRHYIGLYFSKMMDFYKAKDWERLAIKFPGYNNYTTILETLKKEEQLYDAFPNRETLVKQPNGSWEYSFYLGSDSLEDNNRYYGKMVMTFNSIAAKPVITKIAFKKAKPNELYRTSAEFIVWKKEMANLDIPPPPPSLPLTVDEEKELEKRKLEW